MGMVACSLNVSYKIRKSGAHETKGFLATESHGLLCDISYRLEKRKNQQGQDGQGATDGQLARSGRAADFLAVAMTNVSCRAPKQIATVLELSSGSLVNS